MITYKKGYYAVSFDELYALERENFRRPYRWSKTRFKEMIDNHSVWVAYEDEVIPVGYLVAWKQSGRRAYIGGLAVNKRYQDQGIATTLVECAENYYAGKKLKAIKLDVDITNPAQTLYFRLGYRVWKFWKKNQQLGMIKSLA